MRLKIRNQITGVFAVVAVMTILIAATALRTASNYNQYIQQSMQAYTYNTNLYKLRGSVQGQVRIAVQNLVGETRLGDAFNSRVAAAHSIIADLRQEAVSQNSADRPRIEAMSTAYNQFVDGIQASFQAAAKPDTALALKLLTPYISPTLDFVNGYTHYANSQNPLETFIFHLDTLLANAETNLLQLQQKSESAYGDVIQQVLIAGAAALIIIGALLFVLTRNLVQPIIKVLDVAEQIGQGNFEERLQLNSVGEMTQLADAINRMAVRLKTSRAESDVLAASERLVRERLEKAIGDYTAYLEKVGQRNLSTYLTISPNADTDSVSTDLRMLGESLNSTVASLAAIASQSREISNNTASAAAEILAAVMLQVTGGNEQSGAVVKLRNTVEKFRDASRQTTEQALGVTTIAVRLQETVALGESAIEENIASMDRVRTQTESIAASVLALSERTQAISQIISSVDDLAEQSKILALNAAIEAARAGDAGKSFAVVADEVRNLANQSRQATGRISEMLGEIQRATNKVVMTTEEGIKQVDSAVQLVQRAGKAIEALAESVARSSQSAQEILAATEQQTLGVGQMIQAMDNIEQVTAQSVTAGLQTERAAHNLNEMAQRLLRSVEQYQL